MEFNIGSIRQSGINIEYHNISYTEDRCGKPASAGRFGGSDSFVKVDYDINPSALPALSIILWAKADSSRRRMTVLSHDDGGYDRTIAVDHF